MKTPAYNTLKLMGETGQLVDNIISNWLLGIRESNPAIIDMFRDRDLLPHRDLLPWSGEFAGKYITSCYYVYKLTHSKELFEYAVSFINELISYQAEDGYLGCYSKECRLTGAFSQNPTQSSQTWDCWSHYHIMYGLLLWYDLTADKAYFEAVEKTAALFINKFYGDNPRIVSIGSAEMNLAVYHIFGILYRRTKNPDYLYFAKKIEEDLSDKDAGDYINYSLKGYEYYQCPKPRWESMHIIMGIVEMYRNTGDKTYLDVALQIFYSILKTDVHNTGGFSTDEQAIGNPFRNSNIETCCVVAYNALAIELFAETGDIKIPDFLERSHYNAILGSNNPSGKWSTYNTPMEGTRCASRHSIEFQCRPGSPDLNCCSVNAPRGVASMYDWMITQDENTIFINFYERLHAELEDGTVIDINGDYPASNSVAVSFNSKNEKNLALRIPHWSKNTVILCDGEAFNPTSGEYFIIKNTNHSEITVNFDFTPYTEDGGWDRENKKIPNINPARFTCDGEGDFRNKKSIFIGPVLYGLDNGENPSVDFINPPAISINSLLKAIPQRQPDGSIQLDVDNMVLTDFYHLGFSGSSYKTWLSIN